jgi:hypothetical protein
MFAGTYATDYQAQDKFAEAQEMRKKAWANIDRGWKRYEPLPQTPEEAVMWKQFTGEWAAWKALDDKIGAVLVSLASNKDEQKQKDLFVDFYREYNQSRPLFQKAEASLMKIERLNEEISEFQAWRTGMAAIGSAEWQMVQVGQVRSGTDTIATASGRSPAATWTCRAAPSSRPARWKRPRRRWKN